MTSCSRRTWPPPVSWPPLKTIPPCCGGVGFVPLRKDPVAGDLDPVGERDRQALVVRERDEDAGARVVDDLVVGDPEAEDGRAAPTRLDVDPGGGVSPRVAVRGVGVGAARDDVSLETDVDPADDRDHVPAAGEKARVRDGHAGREAVVRAAADVERVDRRARHLDVPDRDLVTENREAVQLRGLGDLETEALDHDPCRRGSEDAHPADVEDRLRGDRVAVGRAHPDLSGPDPDHARAVRRDDPRVVPADPEPARRVALAAGQPGKHQRAARIQLRLQPGRVVATSRAGLEPVADERQRHCRDAANNHPPHHDRLPGSRIDQG